MQRYRSLCVVLVVLLGMMLGLEGVMAVPSALAASASFPAYPAQTGLMLDNVALIVSGQVIPAGHWSVSSPGMPTQAATVTTVHPYRQLTIIAVPYRTAPTTEQLPLARQGGASAYRAALHAARAKAGAIFATAPAISIFGQHVAGEVSLARLPLYATATLPTLIAEWTTDAGQRLWIVRMSLEQPATTTTFAASAPIMQTLGTLRVSSSDVTRPTTVVAATRGIGGSQSQSGTPALTRSVSSDITLPSPSWWNGTTCDTAHTPGSSSLGASFEGAVACGPGGDQNTVYFFSGAFGVLEWECVEYSMRFMYLADQINPYPANGSQVVNNYAAYKSQYNPNGPNMQAISNGTAGAAPQPGDVLSFDPTSTLGHTAVVTASSVDGSGNGSISIIQENYWWSAGNPMPTAQLSVSNWVVGNLYSDITEGWLHNPASDNTTTNTDDVYAVGGDGSLYQYHWYSGSGWSINDLGHPTGVSLIGTPSASTVTQSGGLVQDVYVVGNDGNLHEYWFQNGAWNNGTLAPPSGVAFINSPSSFSYTDSVVHHSVFVLGNNGHLYNYAWAQGSPWTLTDVSSTTGQSASLVNSPSAQTFIQSGVQTQDVYIAGADGNLYEFWYSGSWNSGNVSGAAPLPSGVGVINSPSSFTFSYPGSSTLNHSVLIVGSNGRLYDFAWAQSPWTVTDVTAVTGATGVGFINSPSGDYLVQSGAGVQDFYALGNDNHLHEFWYTSGRWHTGDISSQASATNVTIIGSPSAFSSFLPSAPTTVRHSTFVVTNDGHLREFLWVQNTTPWELLDHGAPSTTTLANSPNAHSYTS